MADIGLLIQNLAKPLIKKPFEYGIVKSVNEQTGTCEVQIDDMDNTFPDISLYCGDINNGTKEIQSIVMFPTVGARCLVLFPNPLYGVLIHASEIDKIYGNVGGKSFEMTKDETIFNEGKNGGLIKIQELTDKINELVDWCKNHTHTDSAFAGTISGNPASGTLTVPAPLQAPQELNKSDFEDENIKH